MEYRGNRRYIYKIVVGLQSRSMHAEMKVGEGFGNNRNESVEANQHLDTKEQREKSDEIRSDFGVEKKHHIKSEASQVTVVWTHSE